MILQYPIAAFVHPDLIIFDRVQVKQVNQIMTSNAPTPDRKINDQRKESDWSHVDH